LLPGCCSLAPLMPYGHTLWASLFSAVLLRR
jgi:hypothetical protein